MGFLPSEAPIHSLWAASASSHILPPPQTPHQRGARAAFEFGIIRTCSGMCFSPPSPQETTRSARPFVVFARWAQIKRYGKLQLIRYFFFAAYAAEYLLAVRPLSTKRLRAKWPIYGVLLMKAAQSRCSTELTSSRRCSGC